MASRTCTLDQIEHDINRVVGWINLCLDKMYEYNTKNTGFDQDSNPTFLVSNQDDATACMWLTSMLELLNEVWYTQVSTSVKMHISWFKKTVIENEVHRERLCFELKSDAQMVYE